MKQPKKMKIGILVQLKTTKTTKVTDKNLLKRVEGDIYIITVNMEEKFKKRQIEDMKSYMKEKTTVPTIINDKENTIIYA